MRIRLILEELAELSAALQKEDIEEVCKETADLLYVVFGLAVQMGLPIDRIFSEVHRSNMTKESIKDKGGKIVKGVNYSPANLSAIIELDSDIWGR